jgi:hypothetical protein
MTVTQTQATAAFNAAPMLSAQMPNLQYGVTHSINQSPNMQFNVVNGTVQEYVNKFHLFAAKTAQSVLEMCKVIHDAKVNLQEKSFLQFCKQINLPAGSSTISKYLKIGERYNQFIKYTDRLPNSWTSLYLITDIPEDQFENVLLQSTTLANVTASGINKILGKSVKPKANGLLTESAAANIYFSKVPSTAEWEHFIANLSNLTQGYGGLINVEYSPKFEASYETQIRGAAIAQVTSLPASSPQQVTTIVNAQEVHPFSEPVV